MAPHLRYLERAILDALTGRGPKRIIVTMPPRHGKSEFCSRWVPAWYLGTYPDNRVILASYEANFAASWGGKCRELLKQHGWMFGVSINPSSHASYRWEIDGHDGGMQTAGVGGPITGKGANLLIVDDPVKNAEEASSPTMREKVWDWWQSTAYTRLEPGAVVIVIQTRWHRDDLSGRIINLGEESGEHWRVINFPAIATHDDELGRKVGDALWPERYSVEELEKKRKAVGAYTWSALYQQSPANSKDALWPGEWFGEHVWFDDWPKHWILKTAAVDPSMAKSHIKSDYQAITQFMLVREGNMNRAYIDCQMLRVPYTQVASKVVDVQNEFKPMVFGVEVNNAQQWFADAIMSEAMARGVPINLHEITNTANKEIRIQEHARHLTMDAYRYKRTPGCRKLVEQMREFPIGEHDDGPDSLEMAMRLAEELNTSFVYG